MSHSNTPEQGLRPPGLFRAKVLAPTRRDVLRRAGLWSLLATSAFHGSPATLAQTVGGIAGSASDTSSWTLEVGKPVQLPKLELLNGRPWRLDDHRGKVVILEFWHSRCPFCMKQNPLLDAFFKEHESKGLEVVTVTIDKKKADAEKYMKDHGYRFGAGLADATWHAIYKSRKGLP
ncbi:MAG: TlpA disulfide reductase family protein, partial [Bordetella sp.]